MRLSVHMMVRNGAAVVGRALRPLRGIAGEVCLTDDASTDGTRRAVQQACMDIGARFRWVALDPEKGERNNFTKGGVTRNLYFRDEPESYRRKLPSYSGAHLLADWSVARNASLSLCSGEYVMKLDADDVVVDPQNVEATLAMLDARPEIAVVMAPYEVMDQGSFVQRTLYSRIWRNHHSPPVYFREVCHECVDWVRRPDGSNWIIAAQGLLFRDMRDSPGDGVRVPHRNLRVLLREYERLEQAAEPPGPHLVAYLADEAAEVLPDLAVELVGRLPLDELPAADRAWCLTSRARAREVAGDHLAARRDYEQAGTDRATLLGACLALESDVLRPSAGEDDYQGRLLLREALARNREGYYPRCASAPEVARAEKLLGE